MDNERICMVNSAHHYEYCPRCAKYATEPTWKLEFCSEACKNLYMTVNKFNFGHITLEEARDELAGIDLSDRETLRFDVKAVIDRIFPQTEPEPTPEPVVVHEPERTSVNKFAKKRK